MINELPRFVYIQKELKTYLFFQIEYSTHTATKPTTPSPPSVLTIDVTLPITSTAGKKGNAAPLSNTSNTISSASTLTAVSAIAPDHFFIVAKISIIWSLHITNAVLLQWVNYLITWINYCNGV